MLPRRRSVLLCSLALGLCSCAVREDVDPTAGVKAAPSADAAWAAGPETRTPRAGDLPELRLELAHEAGLELEGMKVHFREFDVKRGRLGGSKPVYVRTLGESFLTERAAATDAAYMRTRRGAETIGRRYLRGLFAKTGYEPTGVVARPLPWSGDTAGMQLFFDAPNGRMEIAMLNVTRGRDGAGVTIVGRASSIDPGDLLPLRPRLRAILVDR